MKLFVAVKPGGKHQSVEKIDDTHYKVAVKEPPIQGRANKAVIKALSDALGVAPSRLSIISGYMYKQKVIEVL